MAKRITVNDKKKPVYDIILDNSFQDLSGELKNLGYENRKICIVTDTNVEKLYLNEVKAELEKAFSFVCVFVFEAGEERKNLETVKRLYETLILQKFDRKDVLAALGGGVTGDLTGFAAATYMRGIDFIQLPTTLLAQVDSSIGGKTGVDFDQYKNMVGAFHQPKLVYMNLNTLSTLPEEQYYAGMGEILKHGLIQDDAYYEWTISNMAEIFVRDQEVLEELIYKSCEIKRKIVERDPKEEKDRALLNFGHTIGHAVEKLKDFKLLHGECVAVGSVAAAHISWKRGYLKEEEFLEIRDMFVAFSLPISVYGLTAEEILKAAKSDKKMEQGNMKFILLKKPGKAVIDRTVTEEEMMDAISYIIVTDEDLYE